MEKNNCYTINLPKIGEDDSITPFVSVGEWTMPTLLPLLIQEIPNAEIRICSFNISDRSLRMLALQRKNYQSLHLLLDRSLLKTKSALLRFAKNITPHLATENVHAKITLIHNQEKRIGIVSSANFNQTKKIEAGFYFSDIKTYNYFLKEYEKRFTTATPYGRE